MSFLLLSSVFLLGEKNHLLDADYLLGASVLVSLVAGTLFYLEYKILLLTSDCRKALLVTAWQKIDTLVCSDYLHE